MSLSDWLISIAAILWLLTVAWFDIRERKVPHPAWTGIPLIVAAIYRLVSGEHQMVVAAVAIVLLVSERRHLQQKILEGFILAAGILVISWLMFTVEITAGLGIVGIIVFWIAWERHYLEGADAMALITCMMIWPGTDFLTAYLIAGLVWSVVVRIREGGWLKSHPVPGMAIVALGALLFLSWRLLNDLHVL
jgi:hypothetical protein